MTTPKAKILLIEDERGLAAGISYNLEKQGYHVTICSNGKQALELVSNTHYHLIILDIMLPDLDGFSICETLRAQNNLTPILMLTARDEPENRIKGLTLGADDYLGKPFHLQELLTRVGVLLRRKMWDEKSQQTSPVQETTYEISKGLFFDENLLLLESQNSKKQIALTATESKLLKLLIHEQGRTVSRAQILKQVWGLHEDTQTRTLDNFIMRLRNYFETLEGSSHWIESVRGIGYRFKAQEKGTANSK